MIDFINCFQRCDGVMWLDLVGCCLCGYHKSSNQYFIDQKRFEGLLPDSIGDLAVGIEECSSRWRLQRAPFWLVIPSNQTIVRSIYFPGKKKRNLSRVLEWEWEEYFPMPKEKYVYDFVCQVDKEITGTYALVFATLRSYVLPYLQSVEDAGLVVSGIDIAALCTHQGLLQGNKPWIIIEAMGDVFSVLEFSLEKIIHHGNFPSDANIQDLLRVLNKLEIMETPIFLYGEHALYWKQLLQEHGYDQKLVFSDDPEKIGGCPTCQRGFLQRRGYFPNEVKCEVVG